MSVRVEFRDVEFGYAVTAGRRAAASGRRAAAPMRRARPFHLAPLSLSVSPGEILGVIGPNSAGKTTLIRLLTRVVRPTAGEIRLDDRALATLPAAQLAREIAVVPQELPQAFPFTVEQLVLMGRYPHDPALGLCSIIPLSDGLGLCSIIPLSDGDGGALAPGCVQAASSRAVAMTAPASTPRRRS